MLRKLFTSYPYLNLAVEPRRGVLVTRSLELLTVSSMVRGSKVLLRQCLLANFGVLPGGITGFVGTLLGLGVNMW